MKPRFAPRPCPVCDGLPSIVLFHQSFAGIEGARLLDGYDVRHVNGAQSTPLTYQ